MRARAIGFFLLLNVLLRGWFFQLEGSGLTIEKLSNPDEVKYLTYARELLERGPAWLLSERALSAPPGHVLFLATAGGSILAAKVLSILFSAFTLLPVVAIAKRLSADPLSARVPTIAAVLFTLSLPLLRTAPTLLTEPLNTFFVTSALAMALCAGDQGLTDGRRRARWLSAGALLGAATLFRMSTLLLPIGLMAFASVLWIWPFTRRRLALNVPSLLKGLAAFTIGAFLVVTPFIVKNGIAIGHWKLGMGSGALLYLGADPKTDGHEPHFSQYNFDTGEVTGAFTHVQPEGDRRLTLVARHEIARAPLGFFARRVKWPLRLFVGEPADAFSPADSLDSSFSLFGARAAAFSLWSLVWRVLIVAFATAFLATRWNTQPGFVLSGTLVYILIVLLPFFVIPRYSVPLLPFMAAAAAAWFESRRLTARSTLALFSAAVILVTAVAGWRTVFPRRADPADYAAHAVLATWPGGVGTQMWRAMEPTSDVVVGPEGQSVLCGPGGVTLEAEAPLLRLENNQIFLLPLRARSSDDQVLLQLFWGREGQHGFTENQSTLATAFLGAWADVSFRIPAEPDATLRHLRLDTGDRHGLSVKLRRARVTSEGLAELGLADLAERTAEWSCTNDCEATAGDAYSTLGRDPYFNAALDPIFMDFDIRVVVGVKLSGTRAAPENAGPANIFGKLQWRGSHQSKWSTKNQVDFSVPAQTDWVWVRLNPSLHDGVKLWVGELGAVRLVLRCSSNRVLDIGTMKLVKDYRMVGAG